MYCYKFAAGIALAVSLSLAAPEASASVERTTLGPVEHVEATLVVVADDGSQTVYTPADLESFPTYRMTTTTPWREAPAVFEGVLLRDILAKHGLNDNAKVRVFAENGYETDFEREVWEAAPVLVATRVDGKAHSRRARGPIQFVIHADDYAKRREIGERHLVWMAARIEPGN